MSPVTRQFQGIRAVTFDAGGTILAPHPSVGAVYREVALRHGCDFTIEALDAGFKNAFLHVSKDASVLDPEARERDFWRRVVKHSIAPLGAPPQDFEAFFADLYETFAHASRWRVFPQVEATLGALKRRGLRLAVLSNWDHRLHTVLEESGLRAFFDAVMISSEVGFEKPDAGIFRAAERALDVAAEHCLHVGDSRKHDLEGARAAGWHALVVRHAPGASEDHEVDFLADVPARLA